MTACVRKKLEILSLRKCNPGGGETHEKKRLFPCDGSAVKKEKDTAEKSTVVLTRFRYLLFLLALILLFLPREQEKKQIGMAIMM